MKKRFVIALFLIILLTTINSPQSFVISKFNLKTIVIENNLLLKDKDVKSLLIPFYNKNLIFLNNNEVKKALLQNSFIESFKIKKKYPNTLRIRIYEKKPIAILLKKQNKFLLSDKIDLIKFQEIGNFNHLPYVIGDEKKFKTFYLNLEKINFPINTVKKFIFYDINRWDLETKDKKVIKLPKNNYIESLKNYLKLIKNDSFKKYEMFDYRINNQLILK